jgi:RNA polymerase sigma-70 factor (ECF subfamily)
VTNVEPTPFDFKTELLKLIPFLRAFARSLCGHRDFADDLAQDTLAKAWQAQASFEPGSNLKAWLFTILRNQFYSDRRRAWRQVAWSEDAAELIPAVGGDQESASELSDTVRAMWQLSPEQREALILVGAGGFSYEQAAAISGCAVGTVKSRVARARRALIALLDGEESLVVEKTSGDAAGRKIMSTLQIYSRGETADG